MTNYGNIQFLVPSEVDGVIPQPYPASRVMPDWFRKMPALPENLQDNQFPVPTVKRCSPFRDALSLGFIMPLPWAVRVVADDEGNVNFSWLGTPSYGSPIDQHSRDQISVYPTDVPLSPFKFTNPWIVKTDPGWSTLFTHLMNRGEDRFEIFSGVVDTDVYYNGINFPFLWKKYPYEGVLDAGTPIVQAIPFERTEYTAEYRGMTQEEEAEMHKAIASMHAHQHHYTRHQRHRRETSEENT